MAVNCLSFTCGGDLLGKAPSQQLLVAQLAAGRSQLPVIHLWK
jgi:hypothetical protein